MNSLSIAIIQPASDKLKQAGSGLHLTAGLLILAHALSHLHGPQSSPVYFWCQLAFAADIFILVLGARGLLAAFPVMNLAFRLLEAFFFFCIGMMMLGVGSTSLAIIHLLIGLAYACLFYFERNPHSRDVLSFHHTGVNIPGIPSPEFLSWSHINRIEPGYHSIRIETDRKEFRFALRDRLDYDSMITLHEYCNFYLGNGQTSVESNEPGLVN